MVFSTWAEKLHFLPHFHHFHEISNILVILVKLSLFWWKTQKSHFSGSCRFENIGKFTENRKYSENFTFSFEISHFQFEIQLFSHKKSTFRPCLKYQVLPSVFIGSGGHFHENQHFEKIALFSGNATFPLKSEKVRFSHFFTISQYFH